MIGVVYQKVNSVSYRVTSALLILGCLAGCTWGQCQGPLLVMPHNSTGSIGFPEANLDQTTGAWTNEHYYPNSASCTWVIKAPPSHVINMRFGFFDTEEKFDYVTMYSSEDMKDELYHHSGDWEEHWVSVTPDNTLVLTFISDDITSYRGFLLNYRFMPKACVPTGVVVHEPQLIALPPWNLQGALPGPDRQGYYAAHHGDGTTLQPYWMEMSTYPPDLNCTWRINPVGNDVLQVDILRFQTSLTDVLQVFELDGDKLRPYLKFWDDKVPQSTIISTLPLELNFVSPLDGQAPGSGFLLNVTYISRSCSSEPQKLTLPRGYIAYPEANLQGDTWLGETSIFYGPDICSWVLEAPEGYVLNITVLQFDTATEDKLLILDDGAQLLEIGGGLPEEKIIISESGRVTLNFTSASESKNSGFLLQYSWKLKNCKYSLSPTGGDLKSPYYPNTYGDQVRCVWTLNPATKTQIVHFVIIRLRVDKGDFLQLSDGEKSILFTEISEPQQVLELHPVDSVTVNFLSDLQSNQGYFFLKYNVFEAGNCNFTLTSCGWKSIDPLEIWNLDRHNGMMTAQEASSSRLPRGYKATLASPPLKSSGSKGNAVLEPTDSRRQMCLSFQYLLTGIDAHKLKVVVDERGHRSETVWKENSVEVFVVSGPQGDKFLFASVNVSVADEFQISVVYERGYGPHYRVSIGTVSLSEGSCITEETQASITCGFGDSFCGWKNTHTDHKNWLLRSEGISAMANEAVKSSYITSHEQYADLISSTKSRLEIKASSDQKMCLSVKYQVHTHTAELRVLVRSVDDDPSNSFMDSSTQETVLWRQGGYQSPSLLTANIPFDVKEMPERFQIVLRAASRAIRNPFRESSSNGVNVRDVILDLNDCPHVNSCDFEQGFCSWQVMSSGNPVWYIDQESTNNSLASVFSNGRSEDSTEMISPKLQLDTNKHLSFRYRLSHTNNQCLRVLMHDQLKFENISPRVLWEQCKSKGSDWLEECLDLPLSTATQRIIISSGSGSSKSMVWLDNLVVGDGLCKQDKMDTTTLWYCQPKDSMCGMTQPLGGPWQWSYNHLQPIAIETKLEDEIYVCDSGDVLPAKLKCNGVADCPAADDELSCLLQKKHEPIPFISGFNLASNHTSRQAVCSDGRVLNEQWLCDGIPDCQDESDEMNCDQNSATEATEATKACGEGEFLCATGIACATFGCPVGVTHCLPSGFVCDNVPHCNLGEDEHETTCHSVKKPTSNDRNPKSDADWTAHIRPEANDRMECSGGLFLPKSFGCDGRKDCPLDGQDEIGCHHCSGSDFLCPISGVCLPWSSVCDGELSVGTCTDEDFCLQCPPAHFACDVCITSYQICDGVWDCRDGEDETRCMSTYPQDQMMGDDPSYGLKHTTDEGHLACSDSQFACQEGRCIAKMAVCDRKKDCRSGEDETNCPNDNDEVEYYIKAVYTGESNIDKNPLSSYLITPKMQISEGQIGILSFQYRLDSWIGPSNTSLSVDLLEAGDPSHSLVPWSIWRQTGNKGRQWIKETLLIPSTSDHQPFRISFVIQGNSHSDGSEKIHLSHLNFTTSQLANLSSHFERQFCCDFDDSWCGWTQPFAASSYGWVHAITSPHKRRTGPITGYPWGTTTGFLFADSLEGSLGDYADLVSQPIHLPANGICFSLMVFLFGSNVGGMTIIVGQISGEHIFSKELFRIEASQGLTWIPILVPINESHLSDPQQPFIVSVRAHRGSGFEGDIAIDHVTVASGPCADPTQDENIFRMTYEQNASREIFMMKSGPTVAEYQPPLHLSDPNQMGLDEFCSTLDSCTTCVSSAIIKCSWCDEGHFCVSDDSPRSKICPQHMLIFHNTTQEKKSSSTWCPQIIQTDYSTISTPVHSLIRHSFAVMNIQPSHADLEWKCKYTLEGSEPIAAMSSYEDEMNFLRGLESDANNEELWSTLKGFSVNEHHRTENNFIQVPGHFKGPILPQDSSVNSTQDVLMGMILCGDGETTLDFNNNEATSSLMLDLITPAGKPLDNPHKVHVTAYSCQYLAAECETCISLNSSYSCGWCSVGNTCLDKSQCSGRWDGHTSDPNKGCNLQEEFNILSELLDLKAETSDYDTSVDEYVPMVSTKKKVGKNMKKFLGSRRTKHNPETNPDKRRKSKDKRKDTEKTKARHDKKKDKETNKKNKKKSFLRIPMQEGIFVARSIWRLHTGRQYYVPVKKRTLINLGFVRQVTYGDLKDEESRTVLVDGKWKKAIGFYVDLYEKNGAEPVTSIITTKKEVFEQILKQMDQRT